VQSQLPGVELHHAYLPWLDAFREGNIADGFGQIGDALSRLSPYRMLLVGLCAFGIVMVFGWEWWVPIAPLLILFALTNRAVDSILVNDHHAAATTAFFWAALLVGVKRSAHALAQKKWKTYGITPAILYCVVCMLLFLPWVFVWGQRPVVYPHLKAQDTARLQSRIGETDGVLASANLLPRVADRNVVQNTWYVFSGKDELKTTAYTVDPSVMWILFDTEEFLDFRAKPEYTLEQYNAFRSLLWQNFTLVDVVGSVMLFERGTGNQEAGPTLDSFVRVTPTTEAPPQPERENAVLRLAKAPQLNKSTLTVDVLVVDSEKLRELSVSENQQPLLRVRAGNEEIRLPLGYGLYYDEAIRTGDTITTTIQLPERLLAVGQEIEIKGFMVRPESIVRARYQSTARVDDYRSKFLEAKIN
jgi:hypothetical protein